MALPEGTESNVTRTEQWKLHAVGIVRDEDGTGVDVHVIDHRYIDGEQTGETRRRVLTEAESTALWDAVATKTFKDWITQIHQNAE